MKLDDTVKVCSALILLFLNSTYNPFLKECMKYNFKNIFSTDGQFSYQFVIEREKKTFFFQIQSNKVKLK